MMFRRNEWLENTGIIRTDEGKSDCSLRFHSIVLHWASVPDQQPLQADPFPSLDFKYVLVIILTPRRCGDSSYVLCTGV